MMTGLKDLTTWFPVFPLPMFILLGGVVLLWTSKKQKRGVLLVTAGLAWLLVFSTAPLPSFLLENLENKYPMLELSTIPSPVLSRIKTVVVLCASAKEEADRPLSSQLNPTGLVRLIEGIRLHRNLPRTKLLLSSGPAGGGISVAEINKRLALSLGIPEGDILLETRSYNTHDEAVFVQEMVGQDPFIMVTSARHMPRSMALFRKRGMNPIPAPTNFLTGHDDTHNLSQFLPGPRYLDFTAQALYEFFGIVKEKILGRI